MTEEPEMRINPPYKPEPPPKVPCVYVEPIEPKTDKTGAPEPDAA